MHMKISQTYLANSKTLRMISRRVSCCFKLFHAAEYGGLCYNTGICQSLLTNARCAPDAFQLLTFVTAQLNLLERNKGTPGTTSV